MDQKEVCKLLMELDRAFCQLTQEQGVEGWVHYFAENGAMAPAQGEVIRGKDAIRKAMAPAFGQKGFSLIWEPEYAETSEDGSMGFTYGRYIRTTLDEAGQEVKGTGRYNSIWSRQQDGSYRITLDIGN